MHEEIVFQNFYCAFGCSPNATVKGNTQMVMDVVKILLEEYSREDFSIQIPDCFDSLQGTDANFELVTPLTTQPTKVYYQHNVVSKSIAVIFA